MQNVDKLIQSYLKNLESEKNCSPHTLRGYGIDFRQFIDFCKREKQSYEIANFTPVFLRSYVDFLKFEKNYHVNTIRRKIHTLSSFFTFCLENEFIDRNPMASIKAPKELKSFPVYIKEDELLRLIEAPKKYARFESHRNRDSAMIATLAFTGIRRQELLNLNWSDVDFAEMTLTVHKGKGNKDRKVPIIPPLDSYLWAYLQDRLPLSNQAMFISDTGQRISTSNYHVLFKRYVKKAGLSNKISSHKIRHTFATLMYQNGVDIRTLQEILGHEDLNTTSIYAHSSIKHLKKEILKHPLHK